MPTYNKLFNGILHSSLSNNYHEVETFVGGGEQNEIIIIMRQQIQWLYINH